MTDSRNVLEVREVVRSFGTNRVLRGLTASFESGVVHGVVGPNGSGKTTLLKIISGALGFERGSLEFSGHRLAHGAPLPWSLRRRIGLLGHKSSCYSELTGEENLRLYADLYGVDRDRVRKALDRFGLTGACQRKAASYSRGMAQRLAWGRVWLQEPDFLLMDEPTTGLDSTIKSGLLEEAQELSRRGKIVIWVTHDLQELSNLEATVHRIDRGRLASGEGGS